ncbi:dethiobiotin synthase [Nitratifractor sp.]
MQVLPIFITATGTGVGKSYATCTLARLLGERGIRVGVCKPIETGVDGEPADASLLLVEARPFNPTLERMKAEEITAYTFSLPAAPFCADRQGWIEPQRILEKVASLREGCDLLLIEGAGGLLVPITKDWFMIDLARELGAMTLLVTPSHLGCINETLLSLEALRRRGIPHDWCVNLHEDAERFDEVTRPFYDAAFPGWWSLQEGLDAFVDRFLEKEAQ